MSGQHQHREGERVAAIGLEEQSHSLSHQGTLYYVVLKEISLGGEANQKQRK
jgi:hypothetical protein